MVQIPVTLRLVLFVAFALAILVLSVIPAPPEVIHQILSWDKAQHALAYAGLTVLGGWALTPRQGAAYAWRNAFLISVVYGTLLEGAQALGGHRVAQFADAMANAFGAGLIYVFRMFLSFLRGAES
ncbi:MAG: hypothetical protein PWP34_1558 [Desulfuromonadales bacterium]|jgi:VanZ family protein|nr:hypothetical protein [Desulfuromonadales bacterium]